MLIDIKSFSDILIVLLNQQPLIAFASRPARLDVDERKVSVEPLAAQPDLQVAFLDHRGGFGLGARNILSVDRFGRERFPRTDVPHHHSAGAVITFRNNAFEIEIRNRVIFHLHGQTFVPRIERRPFGHRPRFQHAFHLQAEIVVQPARAMPLHHKPVSTFFLNLGRRFRSVGKAPLTFVFFESHIDIVNREAAWQKRRCGRGGVPKQTTPVRCSFVPSIDLMTEI